MTDERFWQIVESARTHPVGTFHEVLSAEDASGFHERLTAHRRRAYRWDVWGAADVATGGLSDDDFIDFRDWLIFQGRDAYEAVLADPDALVDIADEHLTEVLGDDCFGHDHPMHMAKPWPFQREPAGERFSESAASLSRRYPRLWARFRADTPVEAVDPGTLSGDAAYQAATEFFSEKWAGAFLSYDELVAECERVKPTVLQRMRTDRGPEYDQFLMYLRAYIITGAIDDSNR